MKNWSGCREGFRRFSCSTAECLGCHWAFGTALALIILWGVTGPFFHFSDTWQLVINTATTIITFLMVFLIQNTQNRDAKALHLKLDELIRSTAKARNSLVNLENLTDEELASLKAEFEKVQLKAKVRAEQKEAVTCEQKGMERGRDERVAPISELRQN
jgi:low affinity Fe/Cu permease